MSTVDRRPAARDGHAASESRARAPPAGRAGTRRSRRAPPRARWPGRRSGPISRARGPAREIYHALSADLAELTTPEPATPSPPARPAIRNLNQLRRRPDRTHPTTHLTSIGTSGGTPAAVRPLGGLGCPLSSKGA